MMILDPELEYKPAATMQEGKDYLRWLPTVVVSRAGDPVEVTVVSCKKFSRQEDATEEAREYLAGIFAEERTRYQKLAKAAPSMLQLLECIEEAWGETLDSDKDIDYFDVARWVFDTLMPEVRKEIAKAKGES
jgi:hypothetical protein